MKVASGTQGRWGGWGGEVTGPPVPGVPDSISDAACQVLPREKHNLHTALPSPASLLGLSGVPMLLYF